MKRLVVFASLLLLACLVTPTTMALADQKPSTTTYEYVVRFGDFAVNRLFTDLVHYRVPNSAWVCGIDHNAKGGISAVCATPGLTAVVAVRVDCDHGLAEDSASMSLNTSEPGVFANVSLACKGSNSRKAPLAAPSFTGALPLPPLPLPARVERIDDGF